VEYYLSKHLSGPLVGMDPILFLDTFAPAPSIFAMMAYDAVMALGIGACEIESDFFTCPELFESFKKVDFRGATERVLFNTTTGTRDQNYLTYQIYNFIAEADAGEIVTITPYKSQLITLQNESIEVLREFVFFGGNTTPPLGQPLHKEDLNLVSDGVRSICWVLSGALILLSSHCIVFTYRRRNTPTVRASQPIFLVILCAGTLIMACSIIPITLQEPVSKRVLDVACMLHIYLLSIGFSMTFAALFFQDSADQYCAYECEIVSPCDNPSERCLAAVCHLDGSEYDNYSHMDDCCSTAMGARNFGRGYVWDAVNNHESAETTFLCLLGTVNVTALLFSNYQNYHARSLPNEFNETFYLAMTNLIILEGLVIGAPILFVVGDDPAAFMLIRSLLVTIICLAVLVPMFLPKSETYAPPRRRNAIRGMAK
jgi:hypothetical protein